MPTDTSRVEIMTWGATPFDSKYMSPLIKELKGQNSGHGAFTLNLTNTPDQRIKRSKFRTWCIYT